MHLKKLILLFMATGILFASCNNGAKELKNSADISTIKNTSTDSILPTGDNSYNALDWEGTYVGIVPCADCEGIEKTIGLNKENTYTLSSKYLGKKADPIKTTGTFTWNKQGTKISLSGIENGPSQILVGENKLFLLDMSGNRITGNLAEKYILNKQ